MEKHLKRGKYDGEYTEIFKKTSKLYVESASIVYFKVNFKLATVQNGGHTISDEGGKVTDKSIKTMNWDSDMICSLLSLCPLWWMAGQMIILFITSPVRIKSFLIPVKRKDGNNEDPPT